MGITNILIRVAFLVLLVGYFAKIAYDQLPDQIFYKVDKLLKALYIALPVFAFSLFAISLIPNKQEVDVVAQEVNSESDLEKTLLLLVEQTKLTNEKLDTIVGNYDSFNKYVSQNNSEEDKSNISESNKVHVEDEKNIKKADSNTNKMIITDSCNFREGPDSSSVILGIAQKGKAVTVISKESSWAHVIYDGTKGYISLKFLK